MDALRQIEAFVAVVRAGSYVKAAERQETSKAVLSRQVLELETRLGTRLLNRTTRRLSLTETGAAYFERCVQILDDLREADAAAGATTATARGRLRINAPLTFGNLHLAPLWGEFLKLHPAVELDITLTDRVVDLVEEGFDLAVRIAPTGRLPSSSLVARTIADDRIVLCASPGYLRGAPALTHPADLAAHAVMAYAWWSGGDSWQFSGSRRRHGRRHGAPAPAHQQRRHLSRRRAGRPGCDLPARVPGGAGPAGGAAGGTAERLARPDAGHPRRLSQPNAPVGQGARDGGLPGAGFRAAGLALTTSPAP
jgi:DNA-binding transcriptional LysR family regulator